MSEIIKLSMNLKKTFLQNLETKGLKLQNRSLKNCVKIMKYRLNLIEVTILSV